MNRKIMILSLCLLLTLGLAACGNGGTGNVSNKIIPQYLSMTVTQTNLEVQQIQSYAGEITTDPDDVFYAVAGQDVYLYINLNNPDNLDILSFKLNGYKYQVYEFEYGSTGQLLILKINVGNVAGIIDYTIDEIKYVDGMNIKNVEMKGENTVKVNVHGWMNINYNANGGDAVQTQTILEGQTAIEVGTQRNGYIFEGWFDNESLTGEEFDFNSPITQNMTLWAKWRQKIMVAQPTYNGDMLTYGDSLPTITTTTEGGTIVLDEWQTLLGVTHSYTWTFVPIENPDEYLGTTGTMELTVAKATQSINALLEISVQLIDIATTKIFLHIDSGDSSYVIVIFLGLYEFSTDNTTWQNNSTFGNLTAGTEYTFYARLKADDNHAPSESISITCMTPQANEDIFLWYGDTLYGVNPIYSTMENITIPEMLGEDKITNIKYQAFYNNTSLTTITIPDSVTIIAEEAFRDCTSLKTITILATTPPSVGSTAYNTFPTNCTIYVPQESVETYKKHPEWSRYSNKIQPIPSGVVF